MLGLIGRFDRRKKFMKNSIALCLALFSISILRAQDQSSSAIYHEISKLGNSARVLYLAAHPDDENTRMISYLANEKKYQTAYLSLTRGDGGQNLIGTELGAKLGILRTQELMQARRIDGGKQFFSRASDFGYSKTAEETYQQWGKELILSDVVQVIRKFRPDIIITRFPPDARAGHGHHTASAELALEAFDLAADPKAFPEQLENFQPWQVKRIFWNHSSWWNPKLDSLAASDPSYVKFDAGPYIEELGLSCNELASHSRSQHKSQGFGVALARGSADEYLKLLKGEKCENDPMDGVSKKWERFNFPTGDLLIAEVLADFNFSQPHLSVSKLLNLLETSVAINEGDQKAYFQKRLRKIIASCLGLHLELLSPLEYSLTKVEQEFELSYVSRSPLNVFLPNADQLAARIVFDASSIKGEGAGIEKAEDWFELAPNESENLKFTLKKDIELSQPYWLRQPYKTVFQLDDNLLIGQAENEATLASYLPVLVEDRLVYLPISAQYKFSDRVEGEIIRPLMVIPDLVLEAERSNLIFVDETEQTLSLNFRSFAKGEFKVMLQADDWDIEPATLDLNFTEEDSRQIYKIKIKPRRQAKNTHLTFMNLSSGESLKSLSEIDYKHIDKRMVLEAADVKLVRLSFKKEGEKVAYINGAGDKVAQAIELMGYQVDILDESALSSADLSQYQAVIAGIRAYNTQEWLLDYEDKLLAYVKAGGNYIVQYNTRSRRSSSIDFGPFPFEISRKRVTEEDAEVKFALEDHKLLNLPNKLHKADFDNWVQERGLYFADNWDANFQAPLAWHDRGEEDLYGALIVADFGKGSFMYTGISFFRELPAGVPGAFRLFANLISY
jgi:LmbE family N-acetylglucosaminyl deacetylase